MRIAKVTLTAIMLLSAASPLVAAVAATRKDIDFEGSTTGSRQEQIPATSVAESRNQVRVELFNNPYPYNDDYRESYDYVRESSYGYSNLVPYYYNYYNYSPYYNYYNRPPYSSRFFTNEYVYPQYRYYRAPYNPYSGYYY
jgi:hypothetical protein